MIKQTISHYRIVSQPGDHGMGVAYEAEDIKLHRHVALKPSLHRDLGMSVQTRVWVR